MTFIIFFSHYFLLSSHTFHAAHNYFLFFFRHPIVLHLDVLNKGTLGQIKMEYELNSRFLHALGFEVYTFKLIPIHLQVRCWCFIRSICISQLYTSISPFPAPAHSGHIFYFYKCCKPHNTLILLLDLKQSITF